MNQQNSQSTIEVNVIANQLAHAAVVTLRLAEEGVHVVAALANGRRPVLMVDRMPNSVVIAVKRRTPNGLRGTTVVEAADYHHCQLECMRDVPGGPIDTGPRLQAVRNG